MRKLSFLALLLIPDPVYADFVGSLGLSLGPDGETETVNEFNKPYVDHNSLLGLRGEIEAGVTYLALVGAAAYSTASAKSQYDYVNPYNAADAAKVEDLQSTIGLTRLSLGIRGRPIVTKHFRFFMGGGGVYGSMAMNYDKKDFKDKKLSTTGLEEREGHAVRGGYLEVGMDFILSNSYGLRISAQKTYLRSDEFETLANKQMKLEHTYIALSFIQYVDTK